MEDAACGLDVEATEQSEIKAQAEPVGLEEVLTFHLKITAA